MACRSFDVIACQNDLNADVKLAMVRALGNQYLEERPYGFAMSGCGESVTAATLPVVEGMLQWHWRIARMRR